jgi:hypothetical protein
MSWFDWAGQHPVQVVVDFIFIGLWAVVFYMADKWDRILNGPSEINNDEE